LPKLAFSEAVLFTEPPVQRCVVLNCRGKLYCLLIPHFMYCLMASVCTCSAFLCSGKSIKANWTAAPAVQVTKPMAPAAPSQPYVNAKPIPGTSLTYPCNEILHCLFNIFVVNGVVCTITRMHIWSIQTLRLLHLRDLHVHASLWVSQLLAELSSCGRMLVLQEKLLIFQRAPSSFRKC